MAIDLASIDYLVNNTVDKFSGWTPSTGASVLIDTATLPPNTYVTYNFNSNIGDGTSAAQYRKVTFRLFGSNLKDDIDSNYKSQGQLAVLFTALYATTTSGEIMYESILSVINKEDIIGETEEYLEISKVFPTWNKALQEGSNIQLVNTSNLTLRIQDIMVLRSADVSNEQAAQVLNDILSASEPQMFKVYRINDILNGMGFVMPTGREIKWKPERLGNDVIQIKTNYRSDIPVIYIEGEIDLTTDTNDNTSEDTGRTEE